MDCVAVAVVKQELAVLGEAERAGVYGEGAVASAVHGGVVPFDDDALVKVLASL